MSIDPEGRPIRVPGPARYGPAWLASKVGGRIERRLALRKAERAVFGLPERIVRLPHGLPAPLVVSLTSFPARFGTLAKTLTSLLNQRVQADATILWIGHDQMDALPQDVLRLRDHGLTIRACVDIRAFTKLIPSLEAFPDSFIVTADDDLYYEPDWLFTMVSAFARHDPAVICRRAHIAWIEEDGSAAPYNDWELETAALAAPHSATALFPTGIGGVLYPPGCFPPEVLNREVFREICPLADDVWYFWMELIAGIRRQRAGGPMQLVNWPSSQRISLFHQNVDRNRNDEQIRAMEGRYGALGSFLRQKAEAA